MSEEVDKMGKKQEKKKIESSEEVFTKSVRIVSNLIGIYLIIIGIFLIYVFLAFWPRYEDISGLHAGQIQNIEQIEKSDSKGRTFSLNTKPQVQNEEKDTTFLSKINHSASDILWSKGVHVFSFQFEIPYEVRMILLVMIAGAIGGYIYMVSSFIYHMGEKDFKKSWTWWYFLSTLRGSTLALIFYLVLRGGLLNSQITGTELSRFGVTGTAGVIGLFSKQAMKKLSEIFDTMFYTKEDKNPDGD